MVELTAQDKLGILFKVAQERGRQMEKWGEQHYLDGTGPQYTKHADTAREGCDWLAAQGTPRWDAILLEETYEALAETDPEKLEAELIQVAAVAVAWIEDLRSRK